MTVGENLGVGDVDAFDDQERWRDAATQGIAADFIERLSNGYHTQLGRWFVGGQELSGGQWQKVALSRAYMRREADLLILDEPTAALDAGAEAAVFEHFREYAKGRMTLLISHRFSSVRNADHIIVLDQRADSGTRNPRATDGGRRALCQPVQHSGAWVSLGPRPIRPRVLFQSFSTPCSPQALWAPMRR